LSRIAPQCSSLRPVSASQNPDQFSSLGEPIQWCDTACYLEVTLDTWLTWLTCIDQTKKKTAQRMGVLRLLLNRRSDLSIRNGVLLYKQLIRPMVDYGCPYGVSSLASISGNGRCFNPSVFELPPLHLGTLVISKFMIYLGVPFLADHVISLRDLTEG